MRRSAFVGRLLCTLVPVGPKTAAQLVHDLRQQVNQARLAADTAKDAAHIAVRMVMDLERTVFAIEAKNAEPEAEQE